jgi:HPt (histidine-containing phosphotransfer) domain-containing protein
MAAISLKTEDVQPLSGSAEEPIDLDHLRRVTLGDRSLEREILALFVRQAGSMLARMEEIAPSPRTAAAAHTLKGSALGIGAWSVARSADAVERGGEGDFTAAVQAAAAAVDEARSAIAGMLQMG